MAAENNISLIYKYKIIMLIFYLLFPFPVYLVEMKILIWSVFPEKQGVVFPENMTLVQSHVLVCTDGIRELEERVGLGRQCI